MKILVVQDHRSSLDALLQSVRHFGAAAIPAESGGAALAAFVSERPDLVLLDSVLPDISGYEIAQKIRALESPGDWTPIIFLSSPDDEVSIEKGIAAGGDDYLHKPFSEIVLGAKIRAMQRLVLMRASLLALTRKLDATNQELQRISLMDSLTGVANRRYFDETISVEWRRARRHSNSLAVLMFDIDHFKLYNDTYGHLAGDECLRRVAATIRQNTVRPSDLVGRYDGKAFAVILPETTIGGAVMVAEKIRQAIHELNIPHALESGDRITLSVGVASAAPGFDNPPDDLIHAADQALRRAKAEGRDRICRADAA